MNEVKRISVGSKALASYTNAEVKNCLNSAIRQENIATYKIFDDFFSSNKCSADSWLSETSNESSNNLLDFSDSWLILYSFSSSKSRVFEEISKLKILPLYPMTSSWWILKKLSSENSTDPPLWCSTYGDVWSEKYDPLSSISIRSNLANAWRRSLIMVLPCCEFELVSVDSSVDVDILSWQIVFCIAQELSFSRSLPSCWWPCWISQVIPCPFFGYWFYWKPQTEASHSTYWWPALNSEWWSNVKLIAWLRLVDVVLF